MKDSATLPLPRRCCRVRAAPSVFASPDGARAGGEEPGRIFSPPCCFVQDLARTPTCIRSASHGYGGLRCPPHREHPTCASHRHRDAPLAGKGGSAGSGVLNQVGTQVDLIWRQAFGGFGCVNPRKRSPLIPREPASLEDRAASAIQGLARGHSSRKALQASLTQPGVQFPG